MGAVIPFPSTRVRPSPVINSPSKTLVVKPTGRRFVVVMHPILSDSERLVRETFETATVARAFARKISSMYPDLYRKVDDQTGGAA